MHLAKSPIIILGALYSQWWERHSVFYELTYPLVLLVSIVYTGTLKKTYSPVLYSAIIVWGISASIHSCLLKKSFSVFKMALLVWSHSQFQRELAAVFQIMILKIPVNVYFRTFFPYNSMT